MHSVNEVLLVGNVGKDPDCRSMQNGGRVASFSVATSRKWSTAGGEAKEKTEWHKVSAWNSERGPKHADVVEKFVRKGDRILVKGRIEYRTYEKEGQTRYSTEIIATEIVLLGNKRDADDTPYKQDAKPATKKSDDFDDFPGALEEDDDDLPF